MKTTDCFVCGATVPDIQGPTSEQTYLPQSPGCWSLYTEVLAKEYGEWKYPDIHRLTVDCYAAQHPTKNLNQKSAQSVTVHLIGIYLALEKNVSSSDITKRIGEIVGKHKGDFKWLNPPEHLGAITIADISRARTLEEHIVVVRKWAASIWSAWEKYHQFIVEIDTSPKK